MKIPHHYTNITCTIHFIFYFYYVQSALWKKSRAARNILFGYSIRCCFVSLFRVLYLLLLLSPVCVCFCSLVFNGFIGPTTFDIDAHKECFIIVFESLLLLFFASVVKTF